MPLVAKDGSWAVCMPKKTASQSLVNMCETIGVASIVGEWHGGEWDGNGCRYMIVRNPYERLASMFWYSIKEGSFCYGPGDGNKWLERFADELRSPKQPHLEWTATQSRLYSVFKPDEVFKLENGLSSLLIKLNVNIEMRYLNKTKDKHSMRKSFSETFSVIPSLVDQWLQDDAGGWY
jgi:hypothetical protein